MRVEVGGGCGDGWVYCQGLRCQLIQELLLVEFVGIKNVGIRDEAIMPA